MHNLPLPERHPQNLHTLNPNEERTWTILFQPAGNLQNAKPVVSEQYINMISGWYKAKPDTWVTGSWEPDGGSCDNDVHEIFKCLGETALTNAFVVEQNDGSLHGYNCKIKATSQTIEITPYEEIVCKVNLNIKKYSMVKVHFKNKDVTEEIKGGEMKWISMGNVGNI